MRIFKAMLSITALLMPLSAGADEVVKKEDADLGLTIMGAIVQPSSEDSVALIKEASGTVKAVKKDYIILDKYKVLAVYQNSIEVITRDNQHLMVYQGKFEGGSGTKSVAKATSNADSYHEEGFERANGKITVSSSFRDKLVKDDLAKVLMQATAEPYMENGAIVGFKMSQIDDNSIYAKSGVVNGDIITAINGTDLNNIASTVALLRSLKSAEHIDIDVRRGGASQKVSVDVH